MSALVWHFPGHWDWLSFGIGMCVEAAWCSLLIIALRERR
jgi:hypothetical protein